jgi:hypothetical protein
MNSVISTHLSRYYMAFEDNYPGGRIPVCVLIIVEGFIEIFNNLPVSHLYHGAVMASRPCR